MSIEVKTESSAWRIPVVNVDLLKKCSGKHESIEKILSCKSCGELLQTATSL